MIKFKFFKKLQNVLKITLIKLPGKCDIIIYDETRSDLIKSYLPAEKEIFIFKTREKCLYISKYILFDILKNLIKKEYRNLIFLNGFSRYSMRIIKDCYHAAVLNYLKPNLVITFIDNNPRFGRLSRNFSQIRFLAIQNGNRSSWETYENCNHDIYLSFYDRDSINLRKLGWEINQSVSFGSLNAARAFASIKNEKVKRDLLIISSWRGNIEIDDDYLNQFNAMQEMHFYLNNLVRKEKYKASIILYTQKNDQHWYIKEFASNEEDFYKKIYGDNCEILYNNVLGYDVYKHINSSYLSVAFLTSAILEGYLYGHKCLYLNFYKDNYYHNNFPLETVIEKKDLSLMSLKIKNKIRESKRIHQEITKNSKAKSNQNLDRFKEILNENI
tara:strand:- start:557 stop:1714 length:1158 start_codon:yes stop_codon:yes gene_type:complete